MTDIYVPGRYRLHVGAEFRPENPARVDILVLPSGLFGVQDGRTPRRAEGASLTFDQKTGRFVLQGPTGEPVTLDPIALEGIPLGIGRVATIERNRISWTEPGEPSADRERAAQRLEQPIQMFVALLPVLGYRLKAPVWVSQILVRQEERVVGWGELTELLFQLRPYEREAIAETLTNFDSWRTSSRLDPQRWWALTYYGKAIHHLWETPFLDDCFSEVIINLYKAAEALIGTRKTKEVKRYAGRLGLPEDVANELEWLYRLRNSDDVAHAVILQKQSVAHFADREHPDRSMVNAPIGDCERSVSDAGRRGLALELPLLSP